MKKQQTPMSFPSTSEEKKMLALSLIDRFYPESRCTLHFETPLQLLIATILSAQCQDQRVNKVTAELFERFPSAESLAAAPIKELEAILKPLGLYRNKARHIRACCQLLVEKYGGHIPPRLDALVKLPGVGCKTANVILGNAFGVPALAVDTHVARISRRLGLTQATTPAKIEQDLKRMIPEERWIRFSHQLIEHGRNICHARNPQCGACPLFPVCDHGAGEQVTERINEGIS